MAEYKIIIEGHETGLTTTAVENLVTDQFPNAAGVTVEPTDEE